MEWDFFSYFSLHHFLPWTWRQDCGEKSEVQLFQKQTAVSVVGDNANTVV